MKDREPLRGSIAWYQEMAPPDDQPLRDRLIWRSYNMNRLGLQEEAVRRTQQSTDLIRGRLLREWQASDLSTLTQISALHSAHTEGNEHYLLSGDQAQTAAYEVLPEDGEIAGAFRSHRLPVDTVLAARLPAVSYQNVEAFMKQFVTKAGDLFPQVGANPSVDANSVYPYLSALQLALIFIHPFYEVNGRVSEDMMYMFWMRRPDLAHTVRYVSDTGTRIGPKVSERTGIIEEVSSTLLRKMAVELGITVEQVDNIKYFPDLLKKLESPEDSDAKRVVCRSWMEKLVRGLIDNLDDLEYLKDFPGLLALAQNLQNSSTTYTFK